MHKLLNSPKKITAQRKHGRSSINVQNIHNDLKTENSIDRSAFSGFGRNRIGIKNKRQYISDLSFFVYDQYLKKQNLIMSEERVTLKISGKYGRNMHFKNIAQLSWVIEMTENM